jgi:hypothetical protein
MEGRKWEGKKVRERERWEGRGKRRRIVKAGASYTKILATPLPPGRSQVREVM